MAEPNSSIVITDWGDRHRKYLDANYRGVETEELQKIHKSLFHLMMTSESKYVGGYVITFTHEGVREELEYRKAIPEGY